MVKIKLKKCAYIFDSSNSNFSFGTREQLARKSAINDYLRKFYNDNNELLDAEQVENGFNIMIDGKPHFVKSHQVQYVNCDHVLNHLKPANLENFESENFKKDMYGDSVHLYNKKFKSLMVEDFTKDGLSFIRIYFKRDFIRLVKDDENRILWFENYQPATDKEIFKRLDLSLSAKFELMEILNFLRSKNHGNTSRL